MTGPQRVQFAVFLAFTALAPLRLASVMYRDWLQGRYDILPVIGWVGLVAFCVLMVWHAKGRQ